MFSITRDLIKGLNFCLGLAGALKTAFLLNPDFCCFICKTRIFISFLQPSYEIIVALYRIIHDKIFTDHVTITFFPSGKKYFYFNVTIFHYYPGRRIIQMKKLFLNRNADEFYHVYYLSHLIQSCQK